MKTVVFVSISLVSVWSRLLSAQGTLEKDGERDQAAFARPVAAGAEQSASWWNRLHDPNNWRANFQSTYLWQGHPGFSAAYDGPHSLKSTYEAGYTLTSTLFLGFRPWKGAEVLFNPELIQSVELSNLFGLGGLSNSENQKSGGPTAKVYHARAFFRQTFDLGGAPLSIEGGPNVFASETTRRRLVLSAGQMAVIDVFDNNSYGCDYFSTTPKWR